MEHTTGEGVHTSCRSEFETNILGTDGIISALVIAATSSELLTPVILGDFQTYKDGKFTPADAETINKLLLFDCDEASTDNELCSSIGGTTLRLPVQPFALCVTPDMPSARARLLVGATSPVYDRHSRHVVVVLFVVAGTSSETKTPLGDRPSVGTKLWCRCSPKARVTKMLLPPASRQTRRRARRWGRFA